MAELTPIFELRLGDDDILVPSVSVIDGSSLEIRCIVTSNEIAEKPITVLKKGQILEEAERSTMSATIKIPKFAYAEDGGMYECATVLAEKRVRRRVKLSHKVVLPPDMVPCDGPDFCKNGGECGKLKENGDSLGPNICLCPPDYVGPHCENVLIKDFIGKTLFERTKVGMAAGGTCNLISLFFLILLGVLFFRERKRRRRVEGMLHVQNHQSNFESLPLVKEDLYTQNIYAEDQATPPAKRSSAPMLSPVLTNGKPLMTRANAVKKIIAPGDEDDSHHHQPHAS